MLYLFEVAIKLRFLFRSLYLLKENWCFDKFTTFADWSDLYLSAFVIDPCRLKVFALFARKRRTKRLKHTGNLFRNLQLKGAC